MSLLVHFVAIVGIGASCESEVRASTVASYQLEREYLESRRIIVDYTHPDHPIMEALVSMLDGTVESINMSIWNVLLFDELAFIERLQLSVGRAHEYLVRASHVGGSPEPILLRLKSLCETVIADLQLAYNACEARLRDIDYYNEEEMEVENSEHVVEVHVAEEISDSDGVEELSDSGINSGESAGDIIETLTQIHIAEKYTFGRNYTFRITPKMEIFIHPCLFWFIVLSILIGGALEYSNQSL